MPVGAVLVFAALILLAAACGGDAGEARATPGATRSATPASTSTGSDEPARRDPLDLARRFRALTGQPALIELSPPALGQAYPFDLLTLPADPDERPQRRTSSAALRAVSEHAYFFVEEGADVGDGEIDDAVAAFEESVWPAVTGALGPPPIPGVDGDPRIVVLHADLGPAVGGYVTDEDAYPRQVVPRSNQREIVYLNLSVRPLGSDGYTHVLAHELQHLNHRRHDADEETWVNEGLSEVAAALVGKREGFYGAFLERPDTQLTAWEEGPASSAHYGASALFLTYLLEQTAGDVLELAAEQANGVDGIRAFLRTTGQTRAFEQVVVDWAVANFLDQPEGPFGYRERDVSAPNSTLVEGPGSGEGEVHQFAADYLELEAEDFPGAPTFVFEGDATAPVLAGQSAASGTVWWSGRGDGIDSTLTRELDLTDVSAATLTFRTWFDIERWFDYGYVAASRDGGRTWQALAGEHTTAEDPLEVGYGPGYTGRSGGGEEPAWVEERIDLTPYAGARALLRFELITDDGLHRPGWALDDIAVPEIGFFDDAEADAGGWQRQGFRRLSDPLPQRFELRLITFGAAPAVEAIAFAGRNRAELQLEGLGREYSRAAIVVVGTTEGTTEPAKYRYEVVALGAE